VSSMTNKSKSRTNEEGKDAGDQGVTKAKSKTDKEENFIKRLDKLEEQGKDLLKGEPGKIEYMVVHDNHLRFPGRIFYLFLLDTAEDIHSESWQTFKQFMDEAKLD